MSQPRLAWVSLTAFVACLTASIYGYQEAGHAHRAAPAKPDLQPLPVLFAGEDRDHRKQSERIWSLAGTTWLPRLGGRQVAAYRCTIDLKTGTTELDQPRDYSEYEQAAQNKPADHISWEGRTYQILMEDNKGGHPKKPEGTVPWFPDWVRVSLNEIDENSPKVLWTIPVQEFRGQHERHAVRALLIKEGKIRFWMSFWVDD